MPPITPKDLAAKERMANRSQAAMFRFMDLTLPPPPPPPIDRPALPDRIDWGLNLMILFPVVAFVAAIAIGFVLCRLWPGDMIQIASIVAFCFIGLVAAWGI